ncbi:hypothetical protein GJ744_006084 [Endocarpon pusillum]|uniref:Rhodopsin domain-containing protein n=1 Tax=Endocarpon pusillum TaxID=364733 RepID=A0A8H7E754_9EURO|nr:hypothetical protein GJ744_006084 [Endocarpon pusillum]
MATITTEQSKQLPSEYLEGNVGQSLFNSASHGIETWCLIPATYVLCIGHCINGILFVKIGGAGQHLAYWHLAEPHRITTYLKIQTAEEAIYIASVTFPKLAIILLYLKIFVDKWIRRLTWTVGVIILLNGISGLIGIFAICRPFNFKWNKAINGHCANIITTYRFVSMPNILTDVGILLLPISTLYKLQMSKPRKVGIFITFLAGGCGIVTAIIRLIKFFSNDLFSDPTYLCVSIMSWTIIEPGAYLICSILPHLRSLLSHVSKHSKWPSRLSSMTSQIPHLPNPSTGRGGDSSRRDDLPLSSMPAPSAGNKSKVSLKTAASAASWERSGFVQLRESELRHDASYLPGGAQEGSWWRPESSDGGQQYGQEELHQGLAFSLERWNAGLQREDIIVLL